MDFSKFGKGLSYVAEVVAAAARLHKLPPTPPTLTIRVEL